MIYWLVPQNSVAARSRRRTGKLALQLFDFPAQAGLPAGQAPGVEHEDQPQYGECGSEKMNQVGSVLWQVIPPM